jgi:hypothetical protein
MWLRDAFEFLSFLDGKSGGRMGGAVREVGWQLREHLPPDRIDMLDP